MLSCIWIKITVLYLYLNNCRCQLGTYDGLKLVVFIRVTKQNCIFDCPIPNWRRQLLGIRQPLHHQRRLLNRIWDSDLIYVQKKKILITELMSGHREDWLGYWSSHCVSVESSNIVRWTSLQEAWNGNQTQNNFCLLDLLK